MAILLDDGGGNIAAPLRPLFAALTSQKHARSARVWLTVNRHAERLLRDIAQGRAPLAHETFQDHPVPEKVAFLRELCIEHGLLTPVNLDIERFQDWLEAKVEGLPAPDARLLLQYARWVHLNRMRHLDRRGELKKGTFLAAKQSTTVAAGFLQHLGSRGRSPAECTQSDVDDWLATGPTTRSIARTFVRWAVEHRHFPPVEFPYRIPRTTPVIGQQERLEHIRALIDPTAPIPAADRTIALFLLLYAQPLTRVSRMTLDQVETTDDRITVSFSGDRLQIPPPFDGIVRAHLEALPNANTSAHREQAWLFPGIQPGRHQHQGSIMNRLRQFGLDLLGARNAALRALVLEMPAPVVADAFDYSYTVTDRHRRDGGGKFIDYVARR